MSDDPNYTDDGIVVPDDIVQRLERHAAGSQQEDGSTHWVEVGPSLARAALTEIEQLRAEVIAIRAERDCAQIQAAHLARRLVTEARLHGGPP
jgi:hypothetical protein